MVAKKEVAPDDIDALIKKRRDISKQEEELAGLIQKKAESMRSDIEEMVKKYNDIAPEANADKISIMQEGSVPTDVDSSSEKESVGEKTPSENRFVKKSKDNEPPMNPEDIDFTDSKKDDSVVVGDSQVDETTEGTDVSNGSSTEDADAKDPFEFI